MFVFGRGMSVVVVVVGVRVQVMRETRRDVFSYVHEGSAFAREIFFNK